MSLPAILIVEDDPSIRTGLADALRFAGYRPVARETGEEGLQAALSQPLSLVLLDVMLPGIDGFQVLTELRKAKPTLPIILVTARGAEQDCIKGLKQGADDYVVKPFSARELLARVEAVMRRSAERPSDLSDLHWAGRRIDLDRLEVRFDNSEVRSLSEKEGELLRYLALNRGRVVSRDELLQRVWGFTPQRVQSRTVDMHVARLREKLRLHAGEPDWIRTIRSKGYVLETQEGQS
ncbi:MAG: DNA-binding response regulator [Planctomycetota bacterium]|nr:MAG: DNA-binding response regulator [Planctomycetota bacterium]